MTARDPHRRPRADDYDSIPVPEVLVQPLAPMPMPSFDRLPASIDPRTCSCLQCRHRAATSPPADLVRVELHKPTLEVALRAIYYMGAYVVDAAVGAKMRLLALREDA